VFGFIARFLLNTAIKFNNLSVIKPKLVVTLSDIEKSGPSCLKRTKLFAGVMFIDYSCLSFKNEISIIEKSQRLFSTGLMQSILAHQSHNI
jgi:hypothetical protein